MDKPRRLRSTFGVRLAGAALCTAGLAFIGYGTVNGPAKSMLGLTAAPTCATGTECVMASQLPTNVASSTCSSTDIPGNSAPDNTDSWWHFVVPSSQNWSFTDASKFTATFTGGSIESVTIVQSGKGIVVETDGGATLTNAFVTDSGTDETVELEGTGPEGDDFVLSNSCGGGTTSSTTATVSTTKTVTAPGTTVTTTATGPTTTTTAPGTTTTAPGTTTTKTVSTATTVTSPTTVTNNTTATNTVTTTKTNTAATTVTAPGTTVTVTTTVPTTATATTTVTSNHTATTSVTAPTTVTVGTTVTNSATATTTKTVTTGSAGSPTSSTSSSSSSTPTSHVQAATTTPGTGAGSDLEFGTGLVLLVAGGGLIAGATRITRRKRN